MTSRRILIVEDEGIVALDLKGRLGLLGYEVAGRAADGERAVQLAIELHPDLVLMDIRLEGPMDGIQAAHAIRQRCHLPVVFLTAFSEDATLERAKLAEPFGYILKPFDDRDLKTTIEMALYKHQADEEIHRLNRLYATLSQINQAIVRVKTRDELFRDVCRVAVDFGEFRLAWIDWHDESSGRILPVACAGNPDEFVYQRERYSRLDTDAGCFCGRAVREQKTIVIPDLLANPGLGPWQPILAQARLRSAAAIPIRLGGQVCGLFVVYADDPGVLREREVCLLEEAASDVSCALDRMESEQLRERAETALRDSESKFRSIFENMADASCLDEVVYADGRAVDYRILDVNPAFERILGIPGEQARGRLASEVYGFVPFLETYARVAETGESAAFEEWFEPARMHLQITASCPRRGRFSTVFSDVTVQKQAAEAVRQAQADLERAQAVAHVGSWVAESPDRGTLTWSAETHRIFRLTPGSFDGRVETFLSLVHPQDRGALLAAAVRAWRGEAPYALEHRVVLADDSVRWVREEAEVEHDVSGQPLRMVGVVQDITDRKLAMEALRESEERYRELVENLNDVVFAADAEGRLTYVSSLVEQLTGYPPNELVGELFRDFIHPDDWDGLERSFEDAAAGRLAPFEFRYQTRDGQFRWGYTSSRPILKGGRFIGLRGIFADITEWKKDAEEKARLAEQLRQAQKVESIGRLAGGVAHDFNNMLGVILGYGEQLLDELHPRDPLREAAEQIVAAGHRSADLTRQLLAFSRRQTLQPVVLDLNAIIRDVERMLQRVIREDVELRLALAPDLARVKADPGQIQQVLLNLVVNARDAMPRGGHLTIETANVDLDEQFVRTHSDMQPGSYVRLAVSDTDVGMDQETLVHVFEPFFTTKERGKGSGLGLAMVYGIVKQSGGHIWVYSEPGRGTAFNVYLPQTREETPAASPRMDAAKQVGAGQQILVVEDESSLRTLVAKILSDLGYRVHTAANGGEALLLVENKSLRPDLVVTDVIMPNMNGTVLVERLRRCQPHLRVLYMSGYAENAVVQQGEFDPGTPFIQKPFNTRDIAQRVAQALQSERKPAEAPVGVLLIDDESTFRDLVRHACGKAHLGFAGVDNAAAALDVLARQPVDVLLVDRNLPGTDERRVLAAIRAAGYTAPAIILTGDAASADLESLRPLGAVELLEKAADMHPLLATIENVARSRR